MRIKVINKIDIELKDRKELFFDVLIQVNDNGKNLDFCVQLIEDQFQPDLGCEVYGYNGNTANPADYPELINIATTAMLRSGILPILKDSYCD